MTFVVEDTYRLGRGRSIFDSRLERTCIMERMVDGELSMPSWAAIMAGEKKGSCGVGGGKPG